MKIRIVTPGGLEGPRRGNTVTATRWRRILEELGHRVEVGADLGGGGDLLIALHARKSAGAIARFAGPAVVALTGTDLYGELADPDTRASIARADRLVVLQPRAIEALAPEHRDKARVIYQSSPAPAARRRKEGFQVAVIAHLREVKEPLLAAEALRLIPPGAPLRVVHAGAALEPSLGARARALGRLEPRYEWRGELSAAKTRDLIAESQLLALTSRLEGGANVVTEAIAAGTPVVSTRIEGSIGLLGEDYPGFFPVGDAEALAAILERAAGDAALYQELERRCRARAKVTDPALEREAWRALLAELGSSTV